MRWQGQNISAVDEAALPGLESMGGLVRSVTMPEFAGMTFHEVVAKSALNHVPSGSAMPFSWTVNPYRGCSHACTYCLDPETLVMTADGRHVRLADVRVGDELMGTRAGGTYRRYASSTVKAVWSTRKRAYRVTLADGTEIIASGDHRFLTERGWKYVTGATLGAARRPHLTTGNHLQGFGLGAPLSESAYLTDPDFERGYLSGMIRGDGMIFHGTYSDERRVRHIHRFRLALADTEALSRARGYLARAGVPTYERAFTVETRERRAMTAIHTAKQGDVTAIENVVSEPVAPTAAWRAGFLSGIFDAEGSCSRGILRIVNTDERLLETVATSLDYFGVRFVREPPRPNGVMAIRVAGGLPSRDRFFRITTPAITRKLSLIGSAVKTAADLTVVSVEDVGDRDLIDISTDTEDFIANGVISHNCFARNTHTYLDLDAGADFDSQIVVKVNVADVLARELAKPSWRHEPVALGTNTDPYQRAEGRYSLMPGIIDALTASDTPFSILTKGTLLRRDLPRLTDAATRVPIHIAMSIAIPHEPLRQLLEPGAPSFQARLDTVKAATDAGFSTTVFLMPIVPHLTDGVDVLDDAIARIAASGARRVVFGALHLRPGAKEWFWAWLQRECPDLVPAYRGLYPGASVSAPKGYRTWLSARVRPLLRRHGLDGRLEEDDVPPRGSRAPSGRGPVMKTATREEAAAMLF
jgi:DNA repair photolyase